MMGKTHSKGGEVAALSGYLLLSSNGVLDALPVPGWVSLVVLYPFAVWASTAPDLDHGKQSVPSRDVISRSIWHILHATTNIRKNMNKRSPLYAPLGILDCKHRSWQTHSYEALFVLVALAAWLTMHTSTSPANSVLSLVLMGISLGWLAHIILDGLTPEGIWIASCKGLNEMVFKREVLPEKVKIVPRTKFFATGNDWEKIWNRILTVATWVLLFMVILDWFHIKLW